MECRDAKLLMEAYWDRHLPPEMAEHVASHLEACAACRREYGPVTGLLTNPEPVVVPAGLRGRILAVIEETPVPRPAPLPPASYRWWMDVLRSPWIGAMAACLVFFLMGWFSHRFWSGNTIEPEAPRQVVPSPVVLASWTQSLTMPGLVGPLPIMAQAVALERVMQPELPALRVRNRALEEGFSPSSELDPALRELLNRELIRQLSSSPAYRPLGV